jgi:hypothetical protein
LAFRPGGDEAIFASLTLECPKLLYNGTGSSVANAASGAFSEYRAGFLSDELWMKHSVHCNALFDYRSLLNQICTFVFRRTARLPGIDYGVGVGFRAGAHFGARTTASLFINTSRTVHGILADCRKTYATLDAPVPEGDFSVDPSLPTNHLKTAYRIAAKKSHPDYGGSGEAFLKVRMCYEAWLARKGFYGVDGVALPKDDAPEPKAPALVESCFPNKTRATGNYYDVAVSMLDNYWLQPNVSFSLALTIEKFGPVHDWMANATAHFLCGVGFDKSVAAKALEHNISGFMLTSYKDMHALGINGSVASIALLNRCARALSAGPGAIYAFDTHSTHFLLPDLRAHDRKGFSFDIAMMMAFPRVELIFLRFKADYNSLNALHMFDNHADAVDFNGFWDWMCWIFMPELFPASHFHAFTYAQHEGYFFSDIMDWSLTLYFAYAGLFFFILNIYTVFNNTRGLRAMEEAERAGAPAPWLRRIDVFWWWWVENWTEQWVFLYAFSFVHVALAICVNWVVYADPDTRLLPRSYNQAIILDAVLVVQSLVWPLVFVVISFYLAPSGLWLFGNYCGLRTHRECPLKCPACAVAIMHVPAPPVAPGT